MKKPHTIKIELTQGCNRSCHFCPFSKLYKNNINFLKLSTINLLINQIKSWDNKFRIEMAMFGEPTLNPNIIPILKKIRELKKSQLMLCTNGDMLRKNTEENISKLFDAGLNILTIDCYETSTYNYFKKLNKKFNIFDFYKDNYPLYTHKNFNQKHIVLLDSVFKRDGESPLRKIHNYAGATQKNIPEQPFNKTCVIPFRELTVDYKGDVLFCCHDGRKQLIINNIKKQHIKNIWFSKKYNYYRKKLLAKNRNFIPCKECDYFGGFRKGLIYNWFEK